MNTDICTFCQRSTNFDLGDRLIYADEEISLVPTKGCFVPGYSLLIPHRHVKSFAELSQDELTRAKEFIDATSKNITSAFSTQVLIGEHGSSGNLYCDLNCVDHAHLHFIPIKDLSKTIIEIMRTAGTPQIFENLEELTEFRNISYFMIYLPNKKFCVWTNTEKFIKQYIRFIAAKAWDAEQFYNWRYFPFVDNMQSTVERLRPYFNQSELRAS